MGYILECHTPSCSSSWSRLYGNFKICERVTEKLIKDQREITGLTTIDYKQPTWRSTTLLCDKAVEITNAKTHVFADSVLCLGGISTDSVQAWENRIKWYLETRHLKDLNRIDGEPLEFELKIFQGFTTLGLLGHCMERTRTHRIVISVANYARKFLPGHWSFLGLGSKQKWCETCSDKNGDCDKTAEIMLLNLHSESRHRIFRATGALERGELRNQEKGKKLFTTTEVKKPLSWLFAHWFLWISSVSTGPLQFYARSYPMIQKLQGNLQQMNILSGKSLLDFLLLILTATQSRREIWCKTVGTNSNNFLKTINCPNCVATPVWKLWKRTILH